jgi:hypothetical protein
MAVYAVIEQAHRRTGSSDWKSYGDSVRIFLVATTTAMDDDSVVMNAVDPHTGLTVPALLSAHPTRALLYAASKACLQVDDKAGCKWEVTVTYSLINNILPWNEPVLYNWSQQNSDQIVTTDTSGNPILNSAKCPFNPALTATRYEPVLSCVRNEVSFSESTPQAYVGAVNSATFKGAAANFCMCVGIQAQEQIYTTEAGSQTPYYAVTYNFAFRLYYPWQAKVLNAGVEQLDPSSSPAGKLIKILDDMGQPKTEPWPLDSSGHAIPPPGLSPYPGYTGTGSPYYQTYIIYPQVDFNALGL